MSVGIPGLAPEPIISNIEVATSEVAGEVYSYDSATLTVELTDSISDQFKTTSWFADGSYSTSLSNLYSFLSTFCILPSPNTLIGSA